MFEIINCRIPNQKPENINGNREYKRFLNMGSDEEFKHQMKKNKIPNTDVRGMHYLREIKLANKINRRASQLRYRLVEGQGKAVYLLGVEDDGSVDGISMQHLLESISFLYKMVEIVNAKIDKIRIYLGNIEDKYICTARISSPDLINSFAFSVFED